MDQYGIEVLPDAVPLVRGEALCPDGGFDCRGVDER